MKYIQITMVSNKLVMASNTLYNKDSKNNKHANVFSYLHGDISDTLLCYISMQNY